MAAIIRNLISIAIVSGLAVYTGVISAASASKPPGYVGSSECRECHGKFYELWATSHHGLAMQPYTDQFAATQLTPDNEDIVVGKIRYRAYVGPNEGYVREQGPAGVKQYTMLYVMGGKNVYYFLTKLDRGKLQVLPTAYDVKEKKWYDMAGSAVRHIAGHHDKPFPWTDPSYTFNTSCHSCHVSQLSTNYDVDTDTYRTTWHEPGINCETCHGPAEDHVKLCRSTPKDKLPKDLKLKMILQDRGYSAERVNAACSTCHSKSDRISRRFRLGDTFFDHFGLITLEHLDFYPDGRDLGENYTYTLWRMSPCAKSGQLDCIHCHTSSGRYRFADPQSGNQACLPCHQKIVDNDTEHSHHASGSTGNLCVKCHMPMTRFANMRRSDHSMRPPAPASSIKFGSPNACTICHTDHDASWAETYVEKWYGTGYERDMLRMANLIKAARDKDWSRLPEILAYLEQTDREEIHANSFVQLLRACDDDRKWPVLQRLIKNDPSPLVRASAAEALGDAGMRFIGDLVKATNDKIRLVRVRAAVALAGVDINTIDSSDRDSVKSAIAEYKSSMEARPDYWSSRYNLGNMAMARNDFQTAVEQFEAAHKFRPDIAAPLVNASIAYMSLGKPDEAERCLRQAKDIEPTNAAVQLNLGMLLGELGKLHESETAFRAAFAAEPTLAAAAYNLAVILSKDRMDEAVTWARKACQLQPQTFKYQYTLAFYLRQQGDLDGAAKTLEKVLDSGQSHPDAYMLLGNIYEERGEYRRARDLYEKAAQNMMFPDSVRRRFLQKINVIDAR